VFFDPLYMLILAATAGLSFFAQWKVKSAFKKWSQVQTRSGRTGADVARYILRESGVDDVTVEKVDGFLSDHYDPRSKTLRLSSQVYGSTSVAAVGIAAHEVGHAIQHARNYWPLQVRSVLAPAAAFGGNISTFVIIAGFMLSTLGLVKIGIALFAVTVAFVIITLPVEFDASNRAKALLPQLGVTQGAEGQGVASVLNAAAMTYLAAAVAAVAQLLYFMLRAGLIGGRDD
jgi:Zn-dependent membrane protease YugP